MSRPLRVLTFALWWKLLLLLVVCSFARGFLADVLPWGQLTFWLAAVLTRVPIVGEALWSSPRLVETAMAVAGLARDGLLLFAALFVLLRFHVGRRYGGALLVLQRPADAARDLFA